MKRFSAVVALLLAPFVAAMPAHADLALAKSRNCMSCHAVDHKVVGPAYKDVAAKYAGQNATDMLARKILEGGSGSWGPIPMPANTQVSPAEAKKLAAWILEQK